LRSLSLKKRGLDTDKPYIESIEPKIYDNDTVFKGTKFIRFQLVDNKSGIDLNKTKIRLIQKEDELIKEVSVKYIKVLPQEVKLELPDILSTGKYHLDMQIFDKAGNVAVKIIPFYFFGENPLNFELYFFDLASFPYKELFEQWYKVENNKLLWKEREYAVISLRIENGGDKVILKNTSFELSVYPAVIIECRSGEYLNVEQGLYNDSSYRVIKSQGKEDKIERNLSYGYFQLDKILPKGYITFYILVAINKDNNEGKQLSEIFIKHLFYTLDGFGEYVVRREESFLLETGRNSIVAFDNFSPSQKKKYKGFTISADIKSPQAGERYIIWEVPR